MAKHQTAMQLSRALEARLLRSKANINQALDIAARETFHDAQEALSGKTSQKQLAREGHPYGRGLAGPGGRRRGRRKDLPINVDTGKLRNALYIRSDGFGGKQRYRIGLKGGPVYAKYLFGGTRKMIKRPWREFVTKRWKARTHGIRRHFGLRKNR